MRFIHTADWHLGRYFHGMHLTEEQRVLLMQEFLPLVRDENVQAVVIAGDIYDRGIPPVEAVDLFDEILTRLTEERVQVLFIAGNHDSARRLGFGRRLLKNAGVFVRGEPETEMEPIILEDEYGPIAFQLYPYVEPAEIRTLFGETESIDFDQANARLIEAGRGRIPERMRAVAVAHAFLAGGSGSDSERPLAAGGAGNVSPSHFCDFQYTCMGHLHNPQQAGSANIRYSGSLMKYSFDEAEQHKGVNIVEIDGAGCVVQRFQELKPRHDVRRIRGMFEMIQRDEKAYPPSDDFIEVDLLDNKPVLDAFNQLKMRYPNLMQILRPNIMMQQDHWQLQGQEAMQKSRQDLFEQYYQQMKGEGMSQEQQAILSECIREIDREEAERS